MEDAIIGNALIEPNPESYEQFFDHEWCERVFKLVANSTLEDAVNTLMVAWRSANGVHILPWLLVQSLQTYADGEYKGNLEVRASYSSMVVKAVCDKLEAWMPSLDFSQRTELRRALTRIEQEAFESFKIARSQTKFDVAEYWNFVTRTREFPFCILGTQRMNYGSLYFAYEDFLANTIRTKDPSYSSKSKGNPIGKALVTNFGQALADDCWNHEEIGLARHVRHALAHNGGRFDRPFEKYGSRFVKLIGTSRPCLRGDLFYVVDDKIQITPCNTKHLFNVLKDRVTMIVERLVTC